jgi:hypothetical protein
MLTCTASPQCPAASCGLSSHPPSCARDHGRDHARAAWRVRWRRSRGPGCPPGQITPREVVASIACADRRGGSRNSGGQRHTGQRPPHSMALRRPARYRTLPRRPATWGCRPPLNLYAGVRTLVGLGLADGRHLRRMQDAQLARTNTFLAENAGHQDLDPSARASIAWACCPTCAAIRLSTQVQLWRTENHAPVPRGSSAKGLLGPARSRTDGNHLYSAGACRARPPPPHGAQSHPWSPNHQVEPWNLFTSLRRQPFGVTRQSDWVGWRFVLKELLAENPLPTRSPRNTRPARPLSGYPRASDRSTSFRHVGPQRMSHHRNLVTRIETTVQDFPVHALGRPNYDLPVSPVSFSGSGADCPTASLRILWFHLYIGKDSRRKGQNTSIPSESYEITTLNNAAHSSRATNS